MKSINLFTTIVTLFFIFPSLSSKAIEGEALFKQLCITCHTDPAGPSARYKRVAPPVFAMRGHYMDYFPKKSDFIKAMVQFLLEPKEENSLMPNAVKKFGLMNKFPYDKKTFESVASHIYDLKLASPKGRANRKKQECANSPGTCEEVKKRAKKIKKKLGL